VYFRNPRLHRRSERTPFQRGIGDTAYLHAWQAVDTLILRIVVYNRVLLIANRRRRRMERVCRRSDVARKGGTKAGM
jgi:hypothetical protein